MNVFDKTERLSKRQLQAFKIILNHGTLTSGATGSTLNLTHGHQVGGILSALTRNELIEPAGKEEGKRTLNWKLAPEAEKYDKDLKKLVDDILDLYTK